MRYFNFLALLVLAAGLAGVLPGAQAADKKPYVVFVTGDHEYSGEGTLPLIAQALEKHYGMKTKVLFATNEKGEPDENYEKNIPGLEELEKADVAIFFLRWRQLPKDQLMRIVKYLESGKPIVGFRTSTHAFNYPRGHELEEWNRRFGSEALGAPPGWGGDGHSHYGHDCETDAYIAKGAEKNPILKGVDPKFHVRSWTYHVVPKWPPQDATVLVMGHPVKPNKPTAVDNPVAWTWKTKSGGRVFTTTMGHPEDFQVESFQRLVINGIHWAAGQPVPDQWPGKLDINVAYHGIRKKAEKK
ncbi:MAG: ThuA domain-containing protein [Verrucomicrobiota bacterium]